MSEPTLAEQEFERWHELRKDPLKRELADASFVEAWAKVAYLAEARLAAMGRDVNKLQHRIARQRKANRELLVRYRQMEEALRRIATVYSWMQLTDGPDKYPDRRLNRVVGIATEALDLLKSREPSEKSNRVEE